jgi:hypothetical protein
MHTEQRSDPRFDRRNVRKARPTSETEFASVKLAFFHRIAAWANALESRDSTTARQELRHIEILSERLLQDELFLASAASKQLKPDDLVHCITAYLSTITDSMRYSNAAQEPGNDDDVPNLDEDDPHLS